MNYQGYQDSRDMTWELLLRTGIHALPVHVSRICRKLGIQVVSYTRGRRLIEQNGWASLCESTEGFTIDRVIFYQDNCALGRQRFTIAHELGHILLHHSQSWVNRDPSPDDAPLEQAANVFASRLLAPACVLWGLGIRTTPAISRVCDINWQAAQFRAERMEQLYRRESLFIRKYGTSCFLRSALERQVYDQFEEFIDQQRALQSEIDVLA